MARLATNPPKMKVPESPPTRASPISPPRKKLWWQFWKEPPANTMTGKYFISYSRLDQQIAARLHHELENSSPPFPVFMDIYDIKPGQDYDEVLTSAARGCLAVLFLMSADSIAKGTQCKNEWGMALRCRRPVIPIKLEQDVEPPMDFVRSQ